MLANALWLPKYKLATDVQDCQIEPAHTLAVAGPDKAFDHASYAIVLPTAQWSVHRTQQRSSETGE
jgi:hypothetical protein